MKRNDLNKEHNRWFERGAKALGMIVVMYYMLISIRNLIQVIINFSLISANAGTFSIVFNALLYLFMIIAGFAAIRRSKNPYYIIFALVTILIIY